MKNMDREHQLLSDYINDVLYHPDDARIDLMLLHEDHRVLGENIRKLGEWAIEANRFVGALAKGDLDNTVIPSRENIFTENIYEIQDILRRMTEQIEQIVSRNDVQEADKKVESPKRNYEFMVQELRKRTSALENERNLFVQFTENACERIIVLDEVTGEMVFANKVARDFHEKTIAYIDGAHELNGKSGCSSDNPYSEWMHTVEHPDGKVEYYEVHSIYIIWEKRGAVAHMFSDVTEQQAMQEQIAKDTLTGAYSRTYAMQYLNLIYTEDRSFSIAFVDVDYLKYCNDTFGHQAGDAYLLQVVELLKQAGEEVSVCRTGGDEFMVISEAMTGERLGERMEQLRHTLGEDRFEDERGIRKSFSYGISQHMPGETTDVHKLLSDADERMYQNKLENKKKNHMAVKDDRLMS